MPAQVFARQNALKWLLIQRGFATLKLMPDNVQIAGDVKKPAQL